MSDPQLVSEVMTLIVGGHETNACLLNWMWYLLACHPDVQEQIFDELDRCPLEALSDGEVLRRYTYIQQVIEETLRLYPSVWLMNRKAVNDDRIGEYIVPAGTEIYNSPYIIQRSPKLWANHGEFDPDRMRADQTATRVELAQCPFGAGPRNCIGEPLARAEIQSDLMIVARELLLQLQGDTQADINAQVHLMSRRDFIMQPTLRNPCRRMTVLIC